MTLNILKIHPKIPFTALVLEYICNLKNFMTSIILLQIYFVSFNVSMVVGSFKIID
jgi:hypothetical protein